MGDGMGCVGRCALCVDDVIGDGRDALGVMRWEHWVRYVSCVVRCAREGPHALGVVRFALRMDRDGRIRWALCVAEGGPMRCALCVVRYASRMAAGVSAIPSVPHGLLKEQIGKGVS
jgi:hypothetical protein